MLVLGGAASAATDDPLPLKQIGEGVYLHAGRQEDASAANQGDIANTGFIIGSKCVAVIDTGGSRAVGERLLAALRSVTALPVCYVINTHVHPDHVFGNEVFAAEGVTFVGHARLPAALAARGANYRHAIERDLGVRAALPVPPTLTVKDRAELDLGDRVIELRAWPAAHTDSDLTVYDRATGILWLSDLLFVQRIPVVDGSLRGWLAVIEELRGLQPRRVVAGHGDAADWRAGLARQEDYLRRLRDEVRAAIKAHRTLAQAVEEVGQSQRGDWLLFDSFHKRNVTAAYAELEWEE